MTQATTSCFTCSSFDEAKRLYTSLTEMLIRQFRHRAIARGRCLGAVRQRDKPSIQLPSPLVRVRGTHRAGASPPVWIASPYSSGDTVLNAGDVLGATGVEREGWRDHGAQGAASSRFTPMSSTSRLSIASGVPPAGVHERRR